VPPCRGLAPRHQAQGERQVGQLPRKQGNTSQEGKASKGRIPGALWRSSDRRQGSKGANRQEGSQTLKAEHRQRGNLPDQWTFESDMC
jgi:hypothetical protein